MINGLAAVKPKKTNRVARGITTNDLVFSAYQETNDAVFPRILQLYVPEGSLVADVTYETYYGNNGTEHSSKKYHEAVLGLYFKGAEEAGRAFSNRTGSTSSSAKTRRAPTSSA